MFTNHEQRFILLLYVFAVLFLLMHGKPASGVENGIVVCKEREKQALLKIKDDFIDDYGVLSSWGTEEDKIDCCNWEGITCSIRTGHVIKLDFGANFYKPLRGTISPSLFELRHLTYLDLSFNDFGGSEFPTTNNGSFTKLRYLALEDPNLRGTLSSLLRNLSSLQSVYLGYNYFHDNGNTEWISVLSSLTVLDLDLIPLINPNDWLQIVNKLPQLRYLRLESCFSSHEIPLTLSPIIVNSSSSLTELDLADNNLVIPSLHSWLPNISQNIELLSLDSNILQASSLSDFRNMNSIQILRLSNTTVVGGIPKSFGNMSQLTVLYLWSNNLNVSLPDLMRNLSGSTEKSLVELHLSVNQITGSVPDLTRFSSLEVLDLHVNNLNGTIDTSIGRLYKLTNLLLGWNSLTGIISESHFSNMSNLIELMVQGNSLIWNISVDWVPPFHLHVLDIQSSKMGPHFPNWVFFPSKPSSPDQFNSTMTYFDLSNNQFSGVLPNRLMLMQDLVFLNLSNNNFSGEIPTSIGSLSKLQTLNLANNTFSGELPLSLENCTGLGFLDLSGNKLSGNIPTWIGESLLSLLFLSLQSNMFSGSIPLQLCRLTNVQILDLSINHISGTIPRCLNNLTAMAYGNSSESMYHSFNVSSKSFASYHDKALILWKGRKYVFDKNLGLYMIIDLSSNKLEGTIPKEISSLLMLNQLNLSNNKLSGTIPEDVGDLKKLESLDLSQNQLSGRIPDSMSDLNFLSILNLSYNNLSGRIPTSTQLQSFNTSAFSGNPMLCGLPLTLKCPGDNTPQHPPPNTERNEEGGDEFMKWFYISMALGFIVSFWGVCGTLLFKRSCRHAFFKHLDIFGDWLYVTTTVYSRRLQQKFYTYF